MKRILSVLIWGALLCAPLAAQAITQGPVTVYVVHLAPPPMLPQLPNTHGVIVLLSTTDPSTVAFTVQLTYTPSNPTDGDPSPVVKTRLVTRLSSGWTPATFLAGDMRVLKVVVSETQKTQAFDVGEGQ